MSSFANKHNSKANLFTFQLPESFEFKTLKELFTVNGEKQVYKVNLIYVNKKGKFGSQPVIATDSELVNFPSHMTPTIEDIFEDAESISLINNGHVGFKIYTYENDYGLNYGVEWVDIA